LGLALVTRWSAGYFMFEGNTPLEDLWTPAQLSLDAGGFPEALIAEDPAPYADGTRERVMASIVRRQGQPAFRQLLLGAYGGRCAVSGYDASPALEAAHIVPYNGPRTNAPENGLLLRADFHTLFDLGLVAVDTSEMALLVADDLKNTAYRQFEGRRLHVPQDVRFTPSVDRLDVHREWAGI
jgi:putative restriction endonuclease